MKVLLINPSLIKSGVGHYNKTLEKNRGIYPSLGLGYIASSLIDDGHLTFIIDWDACFNGQDVLDGTMLHLKPDVVCFYTMTWTFRQCIELLKQIKKINPNIVSVIGGPQVSSFPKESLELSDFTYAVQGEAEHTIKELMNVIEFNLYPANVKGLVWRLS